eukprot:2431516-Rhodomonas_salina.2
MADADGSVVSRAAINRRVVRTAATIGSVARHESSTRTGRGSAAAGAGAGAARPADAKRTRGLICAKRSSVPLSPKSVEHDDHTAPHPPTASASLPERAGEPVARQ